MICISQEMRHGWIWMHDTTLVFDHETTQIDPCWGPSGACCSCCCFECCSYWLVRIPWEFRRHSQHTVLFQITIWEGWLHLYRNNPFLAGLCFDTTTEIIELMCVMMYVKWQQASKNNGFFRNWWALRLKVAITSESLMYFSQSNHRYLESWSLNHE